MRGQITTKRSKLWSLPFRLLQLLVRNTGAASYGECASLIRLTCQEYSASAKFDSVNTSSGPMVGSRPVDAGGRRYCEYPKQRGVAGGGFCRVRGEISGDLIIIIIQRRLLAVGSSSGQNLKYWRLWGRL